MRVIALMTVVFAVAVANKIKIQQRTQIGGPNTPLIIDHTGVTPSRTTVNVECDGESVGLSLSSTAVGQTSIRIGSGVPEADCQLSLRPYDPVNGLSIKTSAANKCDRADTITAGNVLIYTWNVQIFEQIGEDALLAEEYTGNAQVSCRAGTAPDPDAQTVNQVQPTAQDEGQAVFASVVEFSLTEAVSSSSRIWALTLKPKNDTDLNGLSYTIIDLVATASSAADGGDLPSVKLIDNGCIRDRRGLTVTGVAGTTQNDIKITAFQFRGNPSAVNFEVVTQLCTPAVVGGQCDAVKSVAECAATTAAPEEATTEAAAATTEEVPVDETTEEATTEEATTEEATTEAATTEDAAVPRRRISENKQAVAKVVRSRTARSILPSLKMVLGKLKATMK